MTHKGFVTPSPAKRKPRSRAPHRKARLTRDLCRFDVNTNAVLAVVSRNGAIDWTRVKRVADRYPDDAGLGTAIRTFIWASAKGGPGIKKLADETRRYQRYTCAKAGSGAVEKFKRKFPQRRF